MLFVMTAYLVEGGFRRELIIFTKEKNRYDSVLNYLLKETDLGLSPMEIEQSSKWCSTDNQLGFFAQSNVTASRKQLQPFLDQFYTKK
jgi:hypothetical protein